MNNLKSSVLTAILGDCMGIPYEFPRKIVSIEDNTDDILKSYSKRIGGRYFPTVIECDKGCYSDDTQMLLMTLRSLQYTDFVGAMKAELKAFMSYECGAGKATRQSCKSLEKDKYPWDKVDDYYSFGGNGVAMRVLPHAFQNDNIVQIMTYVFLNGILTHGSPVALVSSQLYVYYIWCLVHNKIFDITTSKEIWGSCHKNLIEEHELISKFYSKSPSWFDEEWNKNVNNLIDLYKNVERDVDTIISSIPVCGNEKGAGTWCVIASILLFECNNIDSITLMKLVSTLKDADTDTLASILGGILGVRNEINEDVFRYIKDIDYICYEIESFQLHQHEFDCDFITIKGLKDKLRSLEVDDYLIVSPFGRVTMKEVVELESLSDSVVSYLYKYSTELGQTLTSLQYRRC